MGLHPVILAGGSGTRLWPLSRHSYPKQFLALTSERSILQETVSRLDGLNDVAPPLFVCNEEHRFLVAEHARQLGKTPLSIILEPEGRNTAPALTLAALLLANTPNYQDAVMLVMPADNVIKDVEAFQSVVLSAYKLATENCMVAVGTVPTSPHTGYGYIQKGEESTSNDSGAESFRVASFVEKPNKAAAERMLESENYLWNSGILVVSASLWLEQIRLHRPDIADACSAAFSQGQQSGDYYRPDSKAFASCPGDFVAYDIMAKVTQTQTKQNESHSIQNVPDTMPDCLVIPLDAGWSDVGDWSALWDEQSKDIVGNAIQGDVDAQSVENSLIIAQHGRVVAEGLEDVIIVETSDAVLVAHKDHVQDVKILVEQLKANSRPELEGYRKMEMPWGNYATVNSGPRFRVRWLTVNPGAALLLQTYHYRTEHLVVVKGTAKVTRGDEELVLTENQSTNVSTDVNHRLENPGSTPLEIIDVQSGTYLEEDDDLSTSEIQEA